MYSTPDDIRKQIPEEVLIQLTDDENLGTVNDDRIVEAIANADAVIDGYSAGRYETPWAPVPQLIRTCSLDIAVYNLFSRRENVPENRKDRYANTMKILARLADGKLTIGESEQPQIAAAGVSKIATRKKQFDEETLERY